MLVQLAWQGICLEKLSYRGAWHTDPGSVQLCGAGRALFARIATQTPEESDRLVAAIEEFMAG